MQDYYYIVWKADKEDGWFPFVSGRDMKEVEFYKGKKEFRIRLTRCPKPPPGEEWKNA